KTRKPRPKFPSSRPLARSIAPEPHGRQAKSHPAAGKFARQRVLRSRRTVGYLRGNSIIAATQELHKAKTMAEGIGQQCKLAPGVAAYWLFELGSHGKRLLHGSVDVPDKEIKMNWRPVTAVVATLAACRRGRCVRLLDQQIDRRGTTKHFHTRS